MLCTPASAALDRQAAPESESRFTIMSTVTPSVTMLSQMVPNLSTSPLAFWMSYSTPAALKAASRLGRSLASQRGDVVVSGRITPILPADESPLLLLPPLAPLPLSLLSSPHAARAPNASTPAAASDATRAPLFLTIPRPPWFGTVM